VTERVVADYTERMSRQPAQNRLQHLVSRIFVRHNFTVEHDRRVALDERPRMLEVDLLLTWRDVTTVVEVKAFRTRTPNLNDIVRASEALDYVRQSLPADHGMLVTNHRRDRLPPVNRIPESIILVGIDDLLHLAGDDVALLDEIADVERELNSSLGEFDRSADLTPSKDPLSLSQFHSNRGGAASPAPSLPSRGAGFAAELREITPGKAAKQKLASGREGVNWRLLEQVGRESLEYVFEDLLSNWREQQSVGGDENRFDAMAKISGDDVFCRTLVEDFRTRHILFEFKNYKEMVKPNLVYITEKYLFPTALRSTAVVISPHGLSPDAASACQGALRDAGKLILDLPTPALCEMLERKDAGVPPSEAMELILDEFLQSLGR
jgi:hypothetical protein